MSSREGEPDLKGMAEAYFERAEIAAHSLGTIVSDRDIQRFRLRPHVLAFKYESMLSAKEKKEGRRQERRENLSNFMGQMI